MKAYNRNMGKQERFDHVDEELTLFRIIVTNIIFLSLHRSVLALVRARLQDAQC